MPWWGILIAGCVSGLIGAALVAWVGSRKKAAPAGLIPEDLLKLEKSRRESAEKALEVEKIAREETQKTAAELARRLRENDEWFERQKAALDAEAREAYEKLAADRGALDRKLDDLLRGATPGAG